MYMHVLVPDLDYPEHTCWNSMWFDVMANATTASLRAALVGAEVSMWSDRYVPRGPASCLYQSPQRDRDFENATSSTIWPRAAIAAGSFWNWDPTLDPAHFAVILRKIGRRVLEAGAPVCPCSSPLHNGCWQSKFWKICSRLYRSRVS